MHDTEFMPCGVLRAFIQCYGNALYLCQRIGDQLNKHVRKAHDVSIVYSRPYILMHCRRFR